MANSIRYFLLIIFAALVVATLSLPLWLTPFPLAFKKFGTTEIAQLLSSIFLIALILERALEVFVTTLRGPRADELDLDVQSAEQEVSQLSSQTPVIKTNLDAANTKLESAKAKTIEYRSITRRIALWTALALGILVSAVGIRALQAIVDPDALTKLSRFQGAIFRLVDVLLTGGMIAGGSDGIHKLANVYDSFMEAAANRAKR